jgi:VanZ family protein
MRIADRRYRWRTKIKNWLPVVAWAGLIFFFSTEQFSSSNTSPIVGTLAFWIFPGISSETIETVHLTIRKLGHWSEYFVLAVLMLRALRNETGKKWELRHAVHTLVFILLYALSDELHQTFVPSRTASFGDVMIDVVGGICGIFWMVWYGRGILTPQASRISEH